MNQDIPGNTARPSALHRRHLLAGMAGLGTAGLAATAQSAPSAAACAASAAATPSDSSSRLPLTVATTEGPYYFDARKERADITEGLEGVPLEVRFTVRDAAGQTRGGMRVDIWHCDAQGRYSGYDGEGDDRAVSMRERTFLRGSLATDGDGVAAFTTIYPGWYAGRTTHIHFKVFHGDRAVLTSQFFLPDALSEFLYTQLPRYRRARLRDTLNSTDGIALEAGSTVIGSVREDGGKRYVATLTLVVDPAAHPALDRPPAPRGGPPGERQGGRGRPGGGPDGPGGAGGRPDGAPPGMRRGSSPLPQPQALEGAARNAALVPGATDLR